jgi:hypothetical protein
MSLARRRISGPSENALLSLARVSSPWPSSVFAIRCAVGGDGHRGALTAERSEYTEGPHDRLGTPWKRFIPHDSSMSDSGHRRSRTATFLAQQRQQRE